MPKLRDEAKVQRLRGLAAAPAEQLDYALSLVATEGHLDVLQAALDVVAAAAEARARPVLIERYASFVQGAAPDAGCYLRTALLRALRHLATPADTGLLEGAVATYEFMRPGPVEVAAALRSVALVTLNEADETLAGYHAVRLLADPLTSRMSGEPAVTAVQVLAAQGHVLPLYGYVIHDEPGEQAVSEVVGECLRHLTDLPTSLLSALIERYRDSRDEIVLLGLLDLLLAHEAHESCDDVLVEFLRTTRVYNVHRYVANMIVAGRRGDLIARLEALAATEKDPRRGEILREALALR